MKRVQRLSILLIILLFILTALWKFTDQNDHYEPQERDDRTELRLFWEHHNHAKDFLNSSVYDSAAFYYEKALAINSEHEGVLYYLGSSRLFLREYDEARKHWEKLAEINPLSARARLQLGNLHFCMAPDNNLYEPATAEDYFHEAHLLNREDTGPQLNLAKISLIQNRLSKADEHLNVVLNVNFLSYQALFLKAYLDWIDEDIDSAHQALQEAQELHKNLTTTVMRGEGETIRGARAMLAEDRFCDLFETEIGRLLQENRGSQIKPDDIFTHFRDRIVHWQLN